MTAPILKTINNANNCHQLGKEENTHTHAQVTGNYRFATANEIILQSFSQLDNQYKKDYQMSKDQTINLICFNKEKLLEYQAPKVLQQCSNHGTSKQNSNMEREQQYQPKEDENLFFLRRKKLKEKCNSTCSHLKIISTYVAGAVEI